MSKLLFILSIVYSSLIHASFSLPTVNWHSLSEDQKASAWVEYRTALAELEISAPDEVAHYQYSFIQEAYAAGFDCFVAGWPSSKGANGKCATPVKVNSNYAHHIGCHEGQLLCNPALFGESLCIDFTTSKQKNSAFAQCETKFAKEGRLFSDVLSEVDDDEMNDIISTVHNKCAINSANYTCQKLRKKLDFLIPNETPVSYKSAQQSLSLLNADKILEAAKPLQREMESDLATYEKVCADGIEEEERRHCKNLALRVKKSEHLLPKLLARAHELIKPADCVNCSTHKSSEVLNPATLPAVPAENLQCTEVEKKKISAKCFDDVKCVILATAMSAPLAVMEAFGKKPDACLSSQNSCLTNVVSALIDSLWSLVTGLWDLLGTALSWTGEKLANFWANVTKIEDKTSDAQHMLNKMSAKEVEEVKQNPIEWISSLAGNIWKGLGQWMKEDIYCEKWAGIPRASQCVQPNRGLDCMSCRTMITGTCSVAGVIIAEVVPALLTGGGANLVARAGTGAKTFSKFIKASKSYKKIVTTVDKLSDVRALKIVATGSKAASKVVKVATRPVSQATKVSMEALSSSYKAITKTKSFQALSKSMDVAAKYTGVTAFNKLNARMYSKGYGFVDSALGVKATSHAVPSILHRMDEAAELVSKSNAELKHIYDDLQVADNLRIRYGALVDEGEEIKKILNLTPEQLERNRIRANEMKDLEGEIFGVNHRFVENMTEVFKQKGIPVTLGSDSHGARMFELDFSNPTSNYAVEMYRRVKDRFGIDRITMSLNENTRMGSRGFFMPGRKRLDMGPEQGMDLLREHFNTVSKHESRHGMFFAKRAKGKDSVFHSKFKKSAKGELLNDKKYYEEYMSAEELYTFSTDLQSLAQGLKGEYITDIAKRDELLKAITTKNKSLNTIANTSKDMSQGMMDSIDDMMKSKHPSEKLDIKSNRDGTWEVSVKDKLGREAELTFVTEADKQIVKNAHEIRVDLDSKIDAFVNQKMSDAGVNLRGLQNDKNYGNVSVEHQRMMDEGKVEYLKTAEAQALTKNLDDATRVVYEKSHTQMSNLNKLATIQLKEVQNLSKELTLFQTGGYNSQLQVVREQMFKTAKNVKEDYSGFALKSP